MTPFAMSLTEVGRWRDTDFPLCWEFGIGGCLRRFSWRNTVYDGLLRREAFNRSGSAASARLTLILSTSPSGLQPTKIRKEGRVGRINGGEVGPDPRSGNLPQIPFSGNYVETPLPPLGSTLLATCQFPNSPHSPPMKSA